MEKDVSKGKIYVVYGKVLLCFVGMVVVLLILRILNGISICGK